MRLAKHLAHAGVASRRAAEQLDVRRPRHGRRRGGARPRHATSTDQEQITVDGRPVGGTERSARSTSLNKPRGRRLDRARHPRPHDRRRPRQGRPAPLPGRAARRRQHGPDPAHRRRRARLPPHAPVASRCRRSTARWSATRRCARRRCASCARASSSTTAARRRPRSAGSPPASSRSPSTRAASARSGACARRSDHRVESLERVAFGPLRLGNLPHRRSPPPDARRGRAARALIEWRAECASTPSAGPRPWPRTTPTPSSPPPTS